MQCENATDVAGPNEGCAEFTGPETIPCTNDATVTMVFDDPYPAPGDADVIFVHVCADCERQLSEGEHVDPDYLTTYVGIVTADEDRAAIEASHPVALPAGLTPIETVTQATVEGVGCRYEVLEVLSLPRPERAWLVRCSSSAGNRFDMPPVIEHETTTLTRALVWVGERVEAEVATELAS